MRALTTVVVIRSLSYTGTTWLNLLLACSDDAFAIGPAHRLFDRVADGEGDGPPMCRVHGDACEFWPGFLDAVDPADNVYAQLAEASGRRVLVTNNPTAGTAAAEHLRHPDVRMREIIVVRDGRAVTTSYLGHNPDAELVDVVRDWLAPQADALAFDSNDPDRLCVRYEDVLADEASFLKAAGEFVGIEYRPNASRFWEHEHHITAGNGGPIATVRIHTGVKMRGPRAEEHKARYESLVNDGARFRDERWRTELARRDLLVFDALAGAVNAGWGYERDAFTRPEFDEIESILVGTPVRPGSRTAAPGLRRRADRFVRTHLRALPPAASKATKAAVLVRGALAALSRRFKAVLPNR